MRRVFVVATLVLVAAALAQAHDRPGARHGVRLLKSVRIPMRDGVRLSTDFYFPERAEEPLATVLMRTPYNKRSHRSKESAARFFRGTRIRGGRSGQERPFRVGGELHRVRG